MRKGCWRCWGAPMNPAAPEEARARPRLATIADVFVRYANFTFGGGSATVAVLHRELLEKRGLVSQDNFALCFALARLTPGTNLLAFCTGIGWLLRRWTGAIVALLASSIPCAVMVIAATALFSEGQGNPWAQAAIQGAVAAAVAVTVKTCWTIAHPHYKHGQRLRVILIASGGFALDVFVGLPPVEILLLAGVLGAVLPPARA